MGAQTEALAATLEQENNALIAAIEGLSDAQWQAQTKEEGWTVAATAHHIAGSHQPLAEMVKAHANGRGQPVSFATLHQMNAEHAKQFVNANKDEVLELLRSGGAIAAATLRGLDDDQLTRSGQFADGMPPLTVQQMIELILIGHVQAHGTSIKNAA